MFFPRLDVARSLFQLAYAAYRAFLVLDRRDRRFTQPRGKLPRPTQCRHGRKILLLERIRRSVQSTDNQDRKERNDAC